MEGCRWVEHANRGSVCRACWEKALPELPEAARGEAAAASMIDPSCGHERELRSQTALQEGERRNACAMACGWLYTIIAAISAAGNRGLYRWISGSRRVARRGKAREAGVGMRQLWALDACWFLRTSL